ncbi:MAG: acyl-CoA synthetase FdrA [Planctomycetota bacterium]
MSKRGVVKPSRYVDSVRLMRVASAAREVGGVKQAAALMGTPNNRESLGETGLLLPQLAEAGPADLILVVEAESDELAAAALRAMEAGLAAEARDAEARRRATVRSLAAARVREPALNLCLLSIPGEYVRFEALRALNAGLHCLIFSDNVPLEDEVYLKRTAAERGLLLMGPDCGTALINGVGLGFCNVVRSGSVGIVGAAGTGIQEVLAAIDAAGGGVCHAIGTGGRDVKDEVGGLGMVQGVRALARAKDIEVLLLVSKPPGGRALNRILTALRECAKPTIACFLGADPAAVEAAGATAVATLEEAGRRAAALDAGAEYRPPPSAASEVAARVRKVRKALAPSQRFVRGLFTGGTLCAEAQQILVAGGLAVHSNVAAEGVRRLADPRHGEGHAVVDLGDDVFTRGRPHPMIDPAERNRRLLEEARDAAVAVILLDFVLGHGVHPDPAGAALPTIAEARALAARAGRHLPVVASITGTAGDPQDLGRQRAALSDAGVWVARSNAAASELAAAIAKGRGD